MKIFAQILIIFSCASVQAQNIEGQIIASQYGKWRVPGYSANTYSFAPDSCRVQGGASFFFAFTMGTPITIVDASPSLTETVTPTALVDSNVSCGISIAPVNDHQLPFYVTSATGGLQEALNQNFTQPQANTVILDNAFYQLVGGSGNVAEVISTVQGSGNLGLVDVTQVPTIWYRWNGSQYVAVGPPTNGGSTLVNDLFSNGPSNAWQDLYAFVATDPNLYSGQAAVSAANAHNGTAILQPASGRAPFVNSGNVRVQDNRADVAATARGITEFGAACDLRSIYGTLSSGSNIVTIIGGYSALFSGADIGRTLVAAGTMSGTPTAFETTIVSIIDSNHGVMTTPAPFSQSINHQMDLGHDDTAAITQGMNAVGGGGTLIFPAGNCLTHTQSLKGESPIGLGPQSAITGFPGEDVFAAPDPSQTTGVNQGPAHIHDLTLNVDARIDATRPWQIVSDSGTIAEAAFYRPIAQKSGVSSNPTAPGWFQGPGPNLSGAANGVAAITGSSAVICVPSSETAPAIGQTVVFPYLAVVFTATVSSTAGSCPGANARTLSSALPSGSTNAQAEWFAGSSPQNLSTAVGSGSCPSSITLSNSISPVPGYESNVAPFGLIQIDGEQFTYFGKSNASNPTPANTLYNIQCAQNGTNRAAHSTSATVVPLNNFKSTYPWPVTPTINTGDTTPTGTAGFFPGWNVGNAAFAFPIVSGINSGSGAVGAWSANASIENLSFYPWPNDINGNSWGEVNHTAMFYFVEPSYATKFRNLMSQYLFYGIAEGPPSMENGNWGAATPTADGTSWDQVAIWAANPVNVPLGNQNTYTNFNVYSNEGTVSSGGLGADTCYYFTADWDDQTGGVVEGNSLDVMTNLYCEPEAGAHNNSMPNWEWDTNNSEIVDQHMGGGGEVYIGGYGQHWYGGNFNNSPGLPAINFGYGNSGDMVANLGSEPKSNVYGTGALINFEPDSRFSGTTAQVYGSASGPYGALQAGNSREPIPSQTNETFNTGNLTVPYTSSGGGFIAPEEFNASFAFEAQAMTQGWTFDSTSPITNGYAACSVGNSAGTTYCSTFKFNLQQISIGPGQRLVPGKYTLYISMKDAATVSNTETLTVWSNCGGVANTYSIPITNTWPSNAAGVFTKTIDLTGATGAGCYIGFNFQGATTADLVELGYVDFSPLAEKLNAQTINVTNIITPGGPTGGTPNGCSSSPVTGIDNGYTCPTKGWGTTLSANQGPTDTTLSLNGSLGGLSPAGCLFVDTEYECYASIAGSTLNGLTRGAYTTTAASHNVGAVATAVDLVLGSIQQSPTNVIVGGGSANTILSLNNAFPNNHGGANVFEINGGGSETWFNQAGTIQQTNGSDTNRFSSPISVGNTSVAFHPVITDTGPVLQGNAENQAYFALGLGGGVAGSLNVVQPASIGAPQLYDLSGGGSMTRSYVCSGIDTDGNLIPGTTVTDTTSAASFSFPNSIEVTCPYAAGVSQYQIWRTVGGPSQGLLATISGTQAAGFQDFNGAASAGTPPASNSSSPHISVAGIGNAVITMGSTTITSAAGAPSTTCGTAPNGSGSLWMRTDGGASTSLYSCAGTTWTAVTVP